jgi:hypothetical protein
MSGAGVLILSIDVELDLEHQDNRLERRLDDVRTELVDLTRSLGVPATWAVADPTLSAATESILSSSVGHEISVLGDQAWLGPGCGRARLSRELARRFVFARKAGIPATTLALRNMDQVRDLDLLLDHGVTALRGPAALTPFPVRKVAAAPIRFGIWQAPPAWHIPPQPVWWAPTSLLLRHEIKRAIRQRTLVHLHVDAQRLIHLGEPALQLVGNVLKYAAAKRNSGVLTIQTINQIATSALAERAATPSRSILRPAA